MKTKKTPMRMCLGCGEMKPKKELIRVVKSPEGEISLDFKGKAAGRGAYICRSTDCLEKARKARRFEKSFSCRIEESVYEVMMNELREEPQDS
ncbi:RNase P modulator RnpM [Ruminococcus flavefaciens]|uniref:RNase P modulator RnpM n=1 Tax=Ruminococcus flavefaciens TaxID=1265 RepID=UPI0026F077F7|nr:YlxR family protein [Ruminococcus flavefaciens]MDD7517042.1 YlxR family protein [Ruminococcus flavefaciens]MDY5692129.1 YlxR family protein [Ruminococcus flavefaciens]